MKIPLPDNQYIKNIVVADDGLDVEYADRKKIALCFISLNERYWPYLAQVIQDCQKHFLTQHKVDYLAWTDMPSTDTPEYLKRLEDLLPEQELNNIRNTTGVYPNNQFFSKEAIKFTVDFIRNVPGITIFPTEPIEWPAPTLMRYHLFLQQEEKLKEYDYVFYLDADMRVLEKIGDEVLGGGLTVAEHPMYSIRKEYIPPYEPNKESAAYIPRLGQIVEENGKSKFRPLYLAGGFQGGKTSLFIDAMRVMRDSIDKDFNNNYTAIWNDESHWNKYVFDHANPIDGHPTVVLSPSYIYPDSLIKEYYEPIWGKKYEPKIMTLTKPFSLTKDGGAALNEFLGNKSDLFKCPQCGDNFQTPGMKVTSVVTCPGSGKAHELQMTKI